MAKTSGFIDKTSTYFDFHKSLYNPTMNERDVYMKAHDDKFYEMKAKAKKQEKKKTGTIYNKYEVFDG